MGQHAKRTNTAIHAFVGLAKDERLGAVALSGPWGTGKTYLVKHFVQTHADTLKSAKLKFAYLSLFGVQSLAEARARLAAAAIAAEKKSLTTIGKAALLKGWVSGEAGGFDISKVGDIAKELVENATLKGLYVCIDDLERAGEGLRPIDVLGFISELTEQRECKVLLILNKEKLTDGAVMRIFEEKVFDLTLDFRPEPSDVVHLAIENKQQQEAALPIFKAFGSANIRVMQRLAWVLAEIGKIKVSGRNFIWPRVVRHAAVLTLLKFERGLSRDDFERVLTRNWSVIYARQMRKGNEKDKPAADSYSDILDDLDYYPEGYDTHIVELINDGAFDEKALKAAFKLSVESHKADTKNKRADAILRGLRSGLQATAADLSKEIREFFSEDLKTVPRGTIAVISDLLLAVDKSREAMASVEKLMTPIFKSVPPEQREGNLKVYPSLLASGVIQKIPYEPSLDDNPTLRQAFDEVAGDPKGWNKSGQFAIIAKYSDAEIKSLFMSLNEPDAMDRIRRLRGRLNSIDELSQDARSSIIRRIDKIVDELAAIDPLHRHKLTNFAAPRP
nr:P-loop NTPase fold protein [Nibricoccus aquaticus]